MNWLSKLIGRQPKQDDKPLDMGLVTGYTMIIPRWQRRQHVARGWRVNRKFREFHYRPWFFETVVTRTPKTLADIDASKLVGQHITLFKGSYGSYGMGGPGFIGLTLSDQPEDDKILIHAMWGADLYTSLDGRKFRYYPHEHQDKITWKENREALNAVLVGSKIERYEITPDKFILHITQRGEAHQIDFIKNNERTAGKTPSADSTISDYILFQNPYAVLWV